MTSRRRFLKTAAIGAAATPVLAAPLVARAARPLKLAGAFPKGFPGVGVNAQRLAERITALSDGAITVSYFGGGELVPPFGVNDAVSSGAVDIGHTAPYYAGSKIKATMYYTSVPYGLMQSELSGWIRYGGGQELWDEAYAPHSLKPFYVGGSGAQAGGWFKKEIKSLDDLQGLKMRIAGLGGDIMRKIGMTTEMLPPPEIFPSLQSGVVDAAEFVGPWIDTALGLYKVAPYYYLPAFHEPAAGLEMIVNLDLWNDLSAQEKAWFESAALATAEETTADFAYHNVRALPGLVEKGAKVSAFPDDVVNALGAAAKEVLEAYPKGDAMSEKIHGAYVDFIKQSAAYGKAVEGQMLADRAQVWGV